MAEYIEREKAIERIKPHVKPTTAYGEWYMKAIEHALDILELLPAADVQPDSYVNAIYTELAELFGSPCNFSPMDEFMLESGKCQNCCGDIPESECWKRYFEMKLKQ